MLLCTTSLFAAPLGALSPELGRRIRLVFLHEVSEGLERVASFLFTGALNFALNRRAELRVIFCADSLPLRYESKLYVFFLDRKSH